MSINGAVQAVKWTKQFWLSWVERVVSTIIQVVVGFLTAFASNDFSFKGWDWKQTLIMLGTTAVLGMLKGLGANALTKTGPGFLNTEQVVPPVSQKAAAEQENAA